MSGDPGRHQFFPPDIGRDVDDELAFHLEMRARELESAGMPSAAARDAAERRFGDATRIARECRAIDERWYWEQRRASMLADVRHDLAYAVRLLARAPSFTIVAAITLALGIGATIAIFTLANWALLRPVPGVSHPQELQQVWAGQRVNGFRPAFVSYPNFADMTQRLKTIRLAGTQDATVNVATGREPARSMPAAFVSGSYFDLLGVRFQAGRPFSAQDDNPSAATLVAVLGDRSARLLFGSPEAALNAALLVNGVHFTIVGVTTAGFQGADRINTKELWMPGSAQPAVNHYPPSMRLTDRGSGAFYQFTARLSHGATWPQAEAELKSVAAWLAAEYPKENSRYHTAVGFHLMGPIGSNALGRERTATMLRLMLGVSALVLLIACSNVASLLMMRGIGRSGEVAIRSALGAGRLRLLRQHLTEGAVLWTLGGIAALFIVWVLMRTADGIALLGQRGGTAEGVPVDGRVVLFAMAVSLLAGILFSIVPALRAIRGGTSLALRQNGPSSSRHSLRAGTALTVVQLALSLTLAVGALLLAATVRQLSRVDVGFDPRGLYTFSVRPGSVGYTPAQAAIYRDEFVRQLSLVPGVQNVSVSIRAPFVQSVLTTRVKVEGKKEPLEPNATEVLSTGYFKTLGVPLRRGREFQPDDLGAAGGVARPVVVVSEALARALFGDADPVGRTIEFATMGRVGKSFEIIGVVGDVRINSLVGAPEPMVYEPAALTVPVRPDGTFIIRTAPGADIAGAVQRIAASLDPALPIVQPMRMEEAIGRARAEWDVLSRLLTTLAGVAGVLAAVGLYGVIAFGVASRRREFGIRLALGAAPARVVALVFRRTALIACLALLLGGAGATALARLLESRLVGVTPFDPFIWSGAALILLAGAALASWIPARRAVSVDVTRSLRTL